MAEVHFGNAMKYYPTRLGEGGEIVFLLQLHAGSAL